MNNILAQNLDQIQSGAFPGTAALSGMSIGGIIGNVLPYVFAAAGIALLVYLILGGLQMMLSQGDPKAIQGAQAKITNALIGFVIIIFAFTITQLFGQVFGIENTYFGKILGR